MSDKFYADVVFDVWRAGGNPDAVSPHLVQACEQAGATAPEVACWELELQAARAAVARDIATWNARHAH